MYIVGALALLALHWDLWKTTLNSNSGLPSVDNDEITKRPI